MQLSKDIRYAVEYSKRKTLGIIVERDGSVVVRAPQGISAERIERVVESKKLWLYGKVNHIQKYRESKAAKKFVSGSGIMYLGKLYRLDVRNVEKDELRFDNKFVLPKSLQRTASTVLTEWFKERAREKLVPKIEFYANQLGVEYKKILVSDLKYRWGSCTPNKTLNFNWRLIKAPMNVIEYIVVHELAHILELNHTPRFWNIVSVAHPKYEKAKEWLKENGHLLEEGF